MKFANFLDNSSSFSILVNLIKKEIHARHAGTILGALWSLFNPLSMIIVYTIVFKYIFQTNDPKFLLHLVTGLLHWQLFTNIFMRSPEWMIGNASILKKVNFPRMIVPLSGLFLGLYYWSFFFILCFILYPLLGGDYTFALSVYPLFLILFVLFCFGISLIISVLTITMRDLKYLIDTLSPILMWLLPILWTSDLLKGRRALSFFIYLNPLGVFFRSFERILYYNSAPSLSDSIAALALTISALLIGIPFFRKRSRLITEYF